MACCRVRLLENIRLIADSVGSTAPIREGTLQNNPRACNDVANSSVTTGATLSLSLRYENEMALRHLGFAKVVVTFARQRFSSSVSGTLFKVRGLATVPAFGFATAATFGICSDFVVMAAIAVLTLPVWLVFRVFTLSKNIYGFRSGLSRIL